MIEDIIKFVAIGGTILGIMIIGAYVPWILIIVVIGIILYLIFNNNTSNSSDNHSQPINNNKDYNFRVDLPEVKTTAITESNTQNNTSGMSEFQKELDQNTKTPQQVADENWIKEKAYITQTVERDYKYIKDMFLQKAKNGEYTTSNQQKRIFYNFECSYLLSCVNRKYSSNPTGRMGTSSYRTNEKVFYHINKIDHYNLYISKITELANEDKISISPFWVEVDMIYKTERSITLPYTFAKDWHTSRHSIKAYLKCSIIY